MEDPCERRTKNIGDNWVYYRDRPEWADVKPIPQNDGPNPVVVIAYSDKFREVFDYFRAILHANEISERAYDLTTDAVNINAANYTVWSYRRMLLKALKKDLSEELDFVTEVILNKRKNYQVWHHRQLIVDRLGECKEELEFTAQILEEDSKNYHAWQYRQWVLKRFGLWDKELEYIDSLLEDDIRNNSAWNQRYFVIRNTGGLEDSSVLDKEIKYTLEAIKKAVLNESSWSYLRGLLRDNPNNFPQVMTFLETLMKENCDSPHFMLLMLDALENKMSAGHPDDRPKLLELAHRLLKRLCEADHIRTNYYHYLAKNLSLKYPEIEVLGDISLGDK